MGFQITIGKPKSTIWSIHTIWKKLAISDVTDQMGQSENIKLLICSAFGSFFTCNVKLQIFCINQGNDLILDGVQKKVP